MTCAFPRWTAGRTSLLVLGVLLLAGAAQGVGAAHHARPSAWVNDFTLTSSTANLTLAVNGTSGYVWEGAETPVPPGDGALTYGGGSPWYSDAISVNDTSLGGLIYWGSDSTLGNFVARSGMVSSTQGFVAWNTPQMAINETYTLQPMPGVPGVGYTTYNVSVTNLGPTSDIRVRFYFDTQLNYNDGSPFFVPGLGEIVNETNFSTPWPYIEDYDSYTSPTLEGLFTPLAGSPAPYLTNIMAWPLSSGDNWTYVTNPLNSITGDSAIAFYYDLGTLSSGQTSHAGVNYGLGSLTQGSLKLNSVTPDRSQYNPAQPFTDQVVVGSTQSLASTGTVNLGIWGPTGSTPAVDLNLPITTRVGTAGAPAFTYLNFTGNMPTPTGLYTVVATLIVAGVNISSVNAVVAVIPFLVGATHSPAVPNVNQPVAFTVTVNIVAANYSTLYLDGTAIGTWQPGAGSFNLVHSPLTAGAHTYNVTTHQGPGNTLVSGGPWTFVVNTASAQGGPLSASLSLTPQSMWQGNTTQVTVTPNGGTPSYTYLWSGLPSGCSAGDVATFSCTPSSTGTSTISVTVTDSSSPTARSVTVTAQLVVTSKPGSGTPPGGILGLGAVGGLVVVAIIVVVLALLLVLLLLRHRRRKAGMGAPGAASPPAPEAPVAPYASPAAPPAMAPSPPPPMGPPPPTAPPLPPPPPPPPA